MGEFRMPSLGADMDEGTIVEWQVHAGDRVKRGDIMAVVQTEKSDLDIEVFEDGVVQELVVPEGRKVAVGTVLAVLAPVGATVAMAPPVSPPSVAPAPEPVEVSAHVEPVGREVHAPHVMSPMIRRLADELHVDVAELQPVDASGRVHRADVERAAARHVTHRAHRASPRARRLGRERALDVARLLGTGPGGAVVGADVLAVSSSAAPPAVQGERAPKADRLLARRRAIGELMTRSWQTIPQYHLSHRISMERALTWLDAHNTEAPVEQRILPAAVLLRAVALAASRSKDVNGLWVDGAFQQGEHVNLGVAVALRDGGLLTPSIARADELTLSELMDELRSLVTRARNGRLRASDTTGATLTVTNLGDVGIDEVTGVIFPPQVAIVGFGGVRPEAWATDDGLVVHRVVHATLAADHRASDGRIGGLFLATIDRLLQEPETL